MAWGMVAGAAISVVGNAVMNKGSGSSGSASATTAEADRLAGIQADQGQYLLDRYKSVYAPLEDQLSSQAQGVGSIANQNKAAQQAGADVAAGFAGSREQLNETPGLNPNSDAYLRQANRTNLAEAASSAAAETGARQNVQAQGHAALTDAVSLGKNLPATASTTLSNAGYGLASAARLYQQQATSSNANAGAFGQAVGGIVGSKSFQNWMNSGNTPAASPGTGYGSVSGGYTAPGETTQYNNPSAYVAPQIEEPVL